MLAGEVVEEEHLHKINGVSKWLYWLRVPLHDQAGNVVGLCAIGRDITERKQQEAVPESRFGRKLSKAMQTTLNLADRVAKSGSVVLLTGEGWKGLHGTIHS